MTHLVSEYIQSIRGFSRNVKLYLITVFLVNLSFNVFQTEFNLYILSLGIKPEFLGVILSLTPFAQALASIPIGFLAEKIGNKRALILINSCIGIAYLLRVVSANRFLILAGAFLTGIMACGYYIIQMPFISHYVADDKNKAFTFTSIIFYLGVSSGVLLGGILPRLIGNLFNSESLNYRIILIFFSLVIIAATIPLFFLDEDKPHDTHKISLSPYLTGIDANTIKFAIVEFFIGIGMMLMVLFINIIFINYYKSTLQFFGASTSLLIFPTVILLFLGPHLAKKTSTLKVIIGSRLLAAIFSLCTVLTMNQFLGAGVYILFRACLVLAQSLGVSYAVTVATRRSRVATSAWLEATFDIGSGLAALLGGFLIAASAYFAIGWIASIALAISFYLTWLFFHKLDQKAEPIIERTG